MKLVFTRPRARILSRATFDLYMSMAKEKEFENNAYIMTEEEAENKPSQQGLDWSLISTVRAGGCG